jgi:hypothetical protein
VKAGRAAIAELFSQLGSGKVQETTGKVPDHRGEKQKEDLAGWIIEVTSSPVFAAPVFHHLWFLWFLCWLVAAFAVYAGIADWLQWKGPPRGLILSPIRFLWLVPLAMIPQWFMGLIIPGFGPDTSAGILPMPQVLLYYAVFFGFGALYFDCNDEEGRVGKWWWLALPLGLFIVFPFGLEFSTGVLRFRDKIMNPSLHRPLAVALQVIYAWMITFACMGLFRMLLNRENKKIRYVSDSSYWLYVSHVPLVIAVQLLVRDWQLPPVLKFALVCLVVSGFLLLVYQTLVRYTWLGSLLNGPRVRPAKIALKSDEES